MDRAGRKIIGSSRYFWHGPSRANLIGWTFLAHVYWGGNYDGEIKRLMLDHAFTFVDHVIFLVWTTNPRSRKAIEKIGGISTDRREKRILHGNTIEHFVYQINKPVPVG